MVIIWLNFDLFVLIFEQFWGRFFYEEIINTIAVWKSFENIKVGLGEKMHKFDSFFYKNWLQFIW